MRNTLIATAIVSIAVNPLLYRAVAPLERWVAAATVGGRALDGVAVRRRDDRDPRHRAVVIGYGPVGRTVARLLRENDITPTIVDLNLDTVRALREEGLPAIYGDAGHRDTLINAGVPNAGCHHPERRRAAAARGVDHRGA